MNRNKKKSRKDDLFKSLDLKNKSPAELNQIVWQTLKKAGMNPVNGRKEK